MTARGRALLIRCVLTLACTLGGGAPFAAATDYAGPIIDAHSHVPNATAIDAYVTAMKRHNVTKVLLLGVGGVQKDDVAWIAAAAKKYPGVVVPAAPVMDPSDAGVAKAADDDGDCGRRAEDSGAKGPARQDVGGPVDAEVDARGADR